MARNTNQGRRSFLKLAAATGAAGLAGCTGDGSDGDGGGTPAQGDGDDTPGPTPTPTAGAQQTGEPMRVGLLFPFSGPISASGIEARNAAEIAAEWVNSEGGLNGQEIELVQADTEASPDTAVQRARQLIQQDDAEVIVGAVSSAVTKAINQFTSTQGVPQIVTGSATPDVTKVECTKTLFRVNTNLIHQQRATVELLKQEYSDLKTVAGVNPDYVYGHQSWEVFQEEFPQAISGGEIINETFPAFLKGDYKKEIQATLNAEPEIVHSTLYSGDLISFIKQAKQFDFFEAIDLFIAGVVPMEVTLALGEAMPDNTIAMGNSYFRWPKDYEPLQRFNANYIDRFSEVPTLFSIDTYVAFEVLKAGAEASGGTSSDDLISGIEGLEIDSIKGPLTMRAADHQGIQQDAPTGPLGPLGAPELAELHGHNDIYGFDPVIPIANDKWADEPECTF